MEAKTIEYFEGLAKAIENGKKVSTGVSHAVMNYKNTCKKNMEYYNIDKMFLLSEEQMQDFVSTLKSAGVKTLTITCKESDVLETLNLLNDFGCRIECAYRIKHVEDYSSYGMGYREYYEPALKLVID